MGIRHLQFLSLAFDIHFCVSLDTYVSILTTVFFRNACFTSLRREWMFITQNVKRFELVYLSKLKWWTIVLTVCCLPQKLRSDVSDIFISLRGNLNAVFYSMVTIFSRIFSSFCAGKNFYSWLYFIDIFITSPIVLHEAFVTVIQTAKSLPYMINSIPFSS